MWELIQKHTAQLVKFYPQEVVELQLGQHLLLGLSLNNHE
jgi:hypothetical protein